MKSIKEITDTWRQEKMETTTEKPVLPDIPSSYEKFIVLLVFGGLAAMAAYRGNWEAATGFATTIGTYVMARQGV